MKRIYPYLLITVIIGATAPFISSCSDKAQSINEWDMSYVTIHPVDHLRPLPPFTLKHSTIDGIQGSVDFSFVAAVQKAANADIVVHFEATCDGFSADKIILSAASAVIKAGTTASDPIDLRVTDWEELESITAEAKYTMEIKITGIESTSMDVSDGTYYKSIAFDIIKTEEKLPEEVLLVNAQDWVFTFMEGVENAEENSVAKTGSGDVATNGLPFWITVDLTAVKTVSGIQTGHWGADFAPKKVELFSSENGREWESIIQKNTSGSRQTIKFESPVKTRYLKYQMIEVPSRVDITFFYVYAWE